MRFWCKRSIISALLALVLAAGFVLWLGGCGTSSGGEETSTPPVTDKDGQPITGDTLRLPFARQDVLDPYALETALNRDLGSLLYEGLFLTDDTWAAQPVLAGGIEQTSALTWLVTVKSGRVFHNGAPVTAADVVYSFNKAKATEDYQARLADVNTCTVSGGAVEFTLRTANQYIAANLDFPIVPDGSAEIGRLEAAQNGYMFTLDSTPSGTGRYQLAADNGEFVLQHDPRHPGKAPALTTIRLYGTNNTAALLYGLELGNYQFVYDNLNSGEVTRVNATPLRVPTTNLIYLGFHSGRGALQDAAVRTALGACINKSAVLGEAYYNYARAVDTPFPPGWHGIKEGDFAKTYNAANALKTLEDLGYNLVNNGVRASKYRQLKFTLLVNKDNPAKLAAARAVKTQLESFQIAVELQSLPLKDYTSAVQRGSFDLYIGEVKLTPDCSLSPLLLSGGKAAGGVQVWGAASSAYGQMLQGLITPAAFVSTFQEETPFLPIGYRDGMAAASRSLHITQEIRRNDLFCGIADWSIDP